MTAFDALDFVAGFRLYQSDKAATIGKDLSESWITAQSRIACRLIVGQVPGVEARYASHAIDDETVLYVVSSMVARVALYKPYHSENDGSYSYVNEAPQSTPPDTTPSASLYLKKSEKDMLAGDDDDEPVGSVVMGLSRIWGG
jgi:hypothetical protein